VTRADQQGKYRLTVYLVFYTPGGNAARRNRYALRTFAKGLACFGVCFFSIFPILFVQLSKSVGNSKWQTDKVRLNGRVYFLLDVKLAVKFKFPINEGTQLGQLFKLFV